ncbi:MAG: tetratricopeptide repeat protein [Candidatus Omnitrophica bacterium]|nr:tetratricopeptide repeat protein [Candidatus Omnitrophota bacterium]
MSGILLRHKLGLIIFGLFLCAALLEAGLRIAGLAISLPQEDKNLAALGGNNQYRIMCLGESTTAFGAENSWPSQLEVILNQANTGVNFKVINKGRPSIETSGILLTLEEDLEKYSPEAVIAMVGVNDWVGTVPYENSFMNRIKLFIRGLRVWQLIRISRLHIVNKFNELAFNKKIHEKTGRMIFAPAMPKDLSSTSIRGDRENVDSGYLCINQGEYLEAESFFKKALEFNPDNPDAHIGLGKCYRETGKVQEAMEQGKKAIALAPANEEGYILLGNCYLEQGMFPESERMFKKALELNPGFEPIYTELGCCYSAQNKIEGIKELAREIIKNKVKNDRLYGFVATAYRKEGKFRQAQEYYKKAEAFRMEYYNPATRHNYQKLKEIILQRKIKLICMQYPLRSIEPLKKLLDFTDGIIFVENKTNFEDALKRGAYNDYFEDNFGGEFGHATAAGNRLIAENAAKAILKEVCNK